MASHFFKKIANVLLKESPCHDSGMEHGLKQKGELHNPDYSLTALFHSNPDIASGTSNTHGDVTFYYRNEPIPFTQSNASDIRSFDAPVKVASGDYLYIVLRNGTTTDRPGIRATFTLTPIRDNGARTPIVFSTNVKDWDCFITPSLTGVVPTSDPSPNDIPTNVRWTYPADVNTAVMTETQIPDAHWIYAFPYYFDDTKATNYVSPGSKVIFRHLIPSHTDECAK